ncbi:MAG TPA: alpha/beta fold hydrolase [Kofleriaceae bacterium]|nr:alpha/beta fold hydrolase [Kofleriaceae bacterium]
MPWSLEHGMIVRRFGAGPELLWLHGLGEWSPNFDAVAAHPALAGFTHVLPDLPGYGRSPWPDEEEDATRDARDERGAPDVRDDRTGDDRTGDDRTGDGRTGDGRALDALVGHLVGWLGDRRPALVGASMGGVLATLIAERTAVRAVVNIDGNISLGDCSFSGKAAAYAIDDFIASGFTALRADVYEAGRTDLALRGYHAALSAASPRMFHRHARELVELSRAEQLAPRFAALRAPALFVAGLPGGICERSRALLDRHAVRWIGLAPAGHWVHRDQPDAFAAAVAAFLRDT